MTRPNKPGRTYKGICSKHQTSDPNCRLCQADVRDLIPNYDQLLDEALAAGLRICWKCGFEHYKTTNMCPRCSSIQNG